MHLKKTSSYGILATVYIATHEKEGPVQGWAIAEECGIPPEYLHKVLLQLVRGRILISKRGRGGGFTLLTTPGQVTLLDIIQAIEGPLDPGLIIRGKINIPPRAKKRFEGVRAEIYQYAASKFGKVTVKQLMD